MLFQLLEVHLILLLLTQKKTSGSYNTSTGAYTTTDTSYSIKVPIEFVRSEEDLGKEIREFRTYITPDIITLTYAGSTRVAKIVNISTLQGGQTYLFTILARF